MGVWNCSEANTASPSHCPRHKRNSECTADQKNSIKFYPLYSLKQDGRVPKYLNKAGCWGVFFTQFLSHWEVIRPGDLIKKPVPEKFMAQIYRSKKWGWFKLISYKHLLSRVLLWEKPEPDFFVSQLAALSHWLSHRKGMEDGHSCKFGNSSSYGEDSNCFESLEYFLVFLL